MMRGWWQRLRAHREARRAARHAIPDKLWHDTIAALPFLQGFSADEEARLRRLASLFLSEKEFHAAGGLELSDAMAVQIAAQAVLPVLNLGLQPYRGFVGIVVHPSQVVAPRERHDEAGVVHHWDEVLAGEALQGGPVMLSWDDVANAGEAAAWGYNVVIHEFAHVLDMGSGQADGMPPLPAHLDRERWKGALESAYEAHCRAVGRGEETAVDAYGSEGIEEFFAVSVECFFVDPQGLKSTLPAWYAMLASYFRQDPASRRAPCP